MHSSTPRLRLAQSGPAAPQSAQAPLPGTRCRCSTSASPDRPPPGERMPATAADCESVE